MFTDGNHPLPCGATVHPSRRTIATTTGRLTSTGGVWRSSFDHKALVGVLVEPLASEAQA